MMALNERAWKQFEDAVADQERLGVKVITLECGARVMDAGVHAAGGLAAGLVMAKVSMAGFGESWLEMAQADEMPWPWIVTHSDHPLLACYLSQSANWAIQVGDFRAMGSGPACLLNQELDPGKPFDFHEKSDCAVLVLETGALPDDTVCRSLAAGCGVKAEKLAILAAPTSSLAGSAQIAARSVETGLHKLHELGFDLRKVVSGTGRCPVAAPTGDDMTSLGKTNDMVMFASQLWLAFKGIGDTDLSAWAKKLPAATSPSYGEPFLQTLKNAGGFYNIDPGLFAPAEVTLINMDTGSTFHAGRVDRERLRLVLENTNG